MKTLITIAMLSGTMMSGVAIAQDSTGQDAARQLIAKCKQDGMSSGAQNIDDYIMDCINKKLQYDTSE